jgi:ADP-ribose pyrophosphatase
MDEGVKEPKPGVGHLDSRVIHDGRVVHLSVDRVRFPDGSEGELELIRHRGASAIVAFQGDSRREDPEIVMIHQYRYAAGGYVYEIPAGIPHDGESWQECARRELEEETGFIPGPLFPLTRIFTTPGFTNEEIHIFLTDRLGSGTVRRDKDEFLNVVSMPFSRALEMAERGEIRDAKSLVGILLANRWLEVDSGREHVQRSGPESSS